MHRLYGLEPGEPAPTYDAWRACVHPDDLASVDDTIRAALAEGSRIEQEFRVVLRDGRQRCIRATGIVKRDAEGRPTGFVGTNTDVTDQRRLALEASYRASHDQLTGLLNRSEFETHLRELVEAARSDGSANALLYVDLDEFKLVNDTGGHAAGDEVLRQVAKLMREAVRSDDTVARIGGDEFALLVSSISAGEAQRLAQGLCDALDRYRYLGDGHRLRVGASIGVVPVDARWTSAEAVMKAADAACYAAKAQGRNRFHTWLESDAAILTRQGEMQWSARIVKAFDDDAFRLYAQRIEPIDATGRRPGTRAEVLLRMGNGDDALVKPGEFLPAAERFHLASRIDRVVVAKTIAWLRGRPTLDDLAMIGMNLSGQSLEDRTFHDWACDLVEAAGPEIRSRICFEVTETAAITNMADASAFVLRMRASGLQVGLDDFGAGASSFAYLKQLPVDFIKIDAQFVRALGTDPVDDLTIRCFVDIAKVMGIRTIAEGVESAESARRVAAAGVDYVQGYFVHRPAALDAVLG
jgi:diguanylate cyclase (GGDEF)-like protein